MFLCCFCVFAYTHLFPFFSLGSTAHLFVFSTDVSLVDVVGSFPLVCSHRHHDRSSFHFVFLCCCEFHLCENVLRFIILRYTVLLVVGCWCTTSPYRSLPLCFVCVTGIVAQRVCLCVAPLTCSIFDCVRHMQRFVLPMYTWYCVMSSVLFFGVSYFICYVVPYCTTSQSPLSCFVLPVS